MRGLKGFHEISGVQAPVKKKKAILMWNPGLSDDEQKKRAVVSDLYEILRTIYKDGRWPRSIIFTSNRQQAQLLSRELNMILRSHLHDHAGLSADEPHEFFCRIMHTSRRKLKNEPYKNLSKARSLEWSPLAP